MMALEQAREYLEQLGLTEAAAVLDNRLDLAAQQKLSYPEVLSDLLGIEAGWPICPFTVPWSSSISASSPP